MEKSIASTTTGEPEVRTRVIAISLVRFSIALRCTSTAIGSYSGIFTPIRRNPHHQFTPAARRNSSIAALTVSGSSHIG